MKMECRLVVSWRQCKHILVILSRTEDVDGAEFANSFIEYLLRIIKHMAPGQQDGDRQEKPQQAGLTQGAVALSCHL